MEPERVKQKSKGKVKSKPKQPSKKIQNVTVKQQHNQVDLQDPRQYLIKLKNELNAHSSGIDVNAQIVKCLKLASKHTTQALGALCQLYQHQPSQFFSPNSNSKERQVRPIFEFLLKTIQCFDVYPLMQRQRVVVINQNFIKWLTVRNETLKQQQLAMMSQMGFKVMAMMIKGEKDRILEHMLYLVLKIPVAVAQQYQNTEEKTFCEMMVRDLMRNIVRLIDSNRAISHQTAQNILLFHQKSFKMLVHSVQNPLFVFPLSDFGTLIFTSKHSQLSKSLIQQTFNMLRTIIDDKRQQPREQMDGSIDRRSFEENQSKINATLLAASFLKFDTVLDPQSLHKKMDIIKPARLLTLLTFKNQILRLVDELQKLDKALISEEVIKGMFLMAKFCSNTNNKTVLHSLIIKIQQCQQLSPYLSDDRFLPSSPQDTDPLEAITKGMEKLLFQLSNRIEKSLCHYNMQPYMDQFIENPYTFRSEYFINKIFQHQKEQIILKFMCGLTSRWLVDENKLFDFSFYLIHLIRKCISQDNMSVLGKFIKAVTAPQLIKINLSIFKLSFEEDNKKYIVPESSSRDVQMACLTSGGYRGKFTYINQIMPNFSQQLMWRQLINQLVPSKNYMDVKAFYNVAHYELSNSDIVGELIMLFQGFIQTEHIEQVHATFHLLHCVLFRYQTQNMDQERRKRYQSILLEIFITKSQRLLLMYDAVFQRRRLALAGLSLSQQSINDNMRFFDRLKRMNAHFLKSIHNWYESLTRIDTILPPRLSYEQVMETLLQYTKDNQYRHLHQFRFFSYYCSQKYLSNILSTKVKTKIQRKELICCNHLLALKDIMSNFMGKYPDERLENDYCIQESHILEYYQFILKTPLNSVNQVQLLKLKMIVLYQMTQLITFFKQNPQNQLFQYFTKLFKSSIKESITQIALQNPEYVSKFSRDFILQLKTIAIVEILKNINTTFQIISLEQSYSLIFQTCFDKCVQIRFMIVNILTSRFKHQQFQRFLYDKYQLCATLTIIALFDINLPIKVTAKRVIETFKNFAKECSSLGLIVLLYAMKELLILTYRNIIKQQYFTCVDTFLTAFHQLWLSDKLEQYTVYAFATRFIDQSRISFMLPESTRQGFIQTYYFQRISSDYYLQSQIKEYLKKEEQFSFDFPSNEIMASYGKRLIQNLMYSLPFRMFAKMIDIIKRKPRQYRILKHKKNIFIDWKMLQRNKLVTLLKEKCDRNVVTFQV